MELEKKCAECAYCDNERVCTKIKDIFGYELIMDKESYCLYSNNFSFTEKD